MIYIYTLYCDIYIYIVLTENVCIRRVYMCMDLVGAYRQNTHTGAVSCMPDYVVTSLHYSVILCASADFIKSGFESSLNLF